MQRIRLCAIIVLIVVLLGVLTGCNAKDGLTYNTKLKNSEEYSFDIVYTASDMPEPIYVSCFQYKGDYAYRFSLVELNFSRLAYRQIYTQKGTLYEICEMQSNFVWTGEYKVSYGVKTDDERNFIYKYTQMITTGSYATLLNKPQKITYRDIECKQYQFNYDGKDLTYVFNADSSMLLKFVAQEGESVKMLEYYNYRFEYVDTSCVYPPSMFGINNGHLGVYRQVDELIYEYFID